MAVPTPQELLDDATAAYHRLMTGTSVVRVRDQNGESVEYNQANANALRDYIKTLQDQITPDARINGPMRVWF